MRLLLPALALLAGLAFPADAIAQARGGGRGGAPTARAAAPKDLTGTWVSVVTEHWHLRMLVPPKGEFAMLPINPEARKVATAWDPKAVAAGTECGAYGAPVIMRVPGRVRIQWTDDNTLTLETDAGAQTRTFRFAGAAPATDTAASWQGTSTAVWDTGARGRGPAPAGVGQLRVNTTNLRAGYLRRNGVPYSERTTVTEYFDTFTEPNGDQWLLVTSIVTDPTYLTGPYATTQHFKKIADRAGWDPTPCSIAEAR